MKLMYPRFSAVRIALATLTVVIVSVLGISAQAKRKPDTKKPVVVTHDPSLGARAGRQLVMEDGRLKSDSASP